MSIINKINAIGQTLYTNISGESKQIDYQELKKARLEICSKCPLFKKDSVLGKEVYVCDSNSYVELPIKAVNEENRLVETTKQVYGCGCTLDNVGTLLPEKTVLVGEETCPINKWNDIEADKFYIEEYTKDFIEINQLDIEKINQEIKRHGIVAYCNSKDLTLQLKPLSFLEKFKDIEFAYKHNFITIVSVYTNIITVNYLNVDTDKGKETEYFTYKQFINKFNHI